MMKKEIGIREQNIQAVKDYFVDNHVAIKSDIAEATKLSQASVTTILQELEQIQFIEYISDCESTGGRKAKQYKLCGSYAYFGLIQLRVAHKKVKVNYQIINLAGNEMFEDIVIIEHLTFSVLSKIIQKMLNKYAIRHLSISVPSIVDDGIITKSDIPAFIDVNLKLMIEDVFPIEVTIENDVNCAMLGYTHLYPIKEQSVAFIYQPDNHHSGCGLYVNGGIVYGVSRFAGELGYLPNGSLEKQIKQLENDPTALLLTQVQSLIAIINPAYMIIDTFCVDEQTLKELLVSHIPEKHFPKFIFIKGMNEYIFKGLFSLSIENARFK